MKTIEELEAVWKRSVDVCTEAQRSHASLQEAVVAMQKASHRAFDVYVDAKMSRDAAFVALISARQSELASRMPTSIHAASTAEVAQPPKGLKRLVNLKEVSAYIGTTMDALRKRIKRGITDIPHRKYSDRTYLFDLDEVDAWIAKGGKA